MNKPQKPVSEINHGKERSFALAAWQDADCHDHCPSSTVRRLCQYIESLQEELKKSEWYRDQNAELMNKMEERLEEEEGKLQEVTSLLYKDTMGLNKDLKESERKLDLAEKTIVVTIEQLDSEKVSDFQISTVLRHSKAAISAINPTTDGK